MSPRKPSESAQDLVTELPTALIIKALELESPQLAKINMRIIGSGGRPIPPREPFLSRARALLSPPTAADPATAEHGSVTHAGT
jgi:hypothetical protein